MRVLIAFDKFKDCMTAQRACSIAVRAVREAAADARIAEAPLTDGGEGFCEILTKARGGELSTHRVHGPRFAPLDAVIGTVDLQRLDAGLREFLVVPDRGTLAIVEMAQASGLASLAGDERDPWHTSTYGTGELLRIAADAGAGAVLLGIGGSATSDIGLGALEALGLGCEDGDGEPIEHAVPADWPRASTLRGEAMPLPTIRIACDVANPLLGPQGAAAVYGPQKGLKPGDLTRLEREMERMARMLCEHHGVSERRLGEPSSGAAGGLGFGLRVATAARYVPGFELVWRWLSLQERLEAADLVITGEGSFDASSLQGKGPGTLVRSAAKLGKRVMVFAGRIDDGLNHALPDAGGKGSFHCITPRGLPLDQALAEAPQRLHNAVREALAEAF